MAGFYVHFFSKICNKELYRTRLDSRSVGWSPHMSVSIMVQEVRIGTVTVLAQHNHTSILNTQHSNIGSNCPFQPALWSYHIISYHNNNNNNYYYYYYYYYHYYYRYYNTIVFCLSVCLSVCLSLFLSVCLVCQPAMISTQALEAVTPDELSRAARIFAEMKVLIL